MTYLSFYRFDSIPTKIGAFFMMLFGHLLIRIGHKPTFYKLLGSGKARFSPWADWGLYAVLEHYDDMPKEYDGFIESKLHRAYYKLASSRMILHLNAIQARGLWDGKQVFPNGELNPKLPVVVLTRATIKIRFLKKFWNFVPLSQKSGFHDSTGLLFHAGIGERPFTRMATLSAWRSLDDVFQYAYRQEGHIQAIAQTRSLGWYSEEMFCRFNLVSAHGNFASFGADKLSPEYLEA